MLGDKEYLHNFGKKTACKTFKQTDKENIKTALGEKYREARMSISTVSSSGSSIIRYGEQYDRVS